MKLPFALECEPPLLVVRFDEMQRTLGWSITKPGFESTREIAWLEVSNADLPPHIDPIAFSRRTLSSSGLDEAVAFMTSRDIRRHHVAQSCVGGVIVTCVTTVGLSNGERVGSRGNVGIRRPGTINTLVHVSSSLSAGAFVEAISIATEARTTAILDSGHLRQGTAITGTGTDCIVVAAPEGSALERCAGLHTDLGEAIGSAVYDATYEGAEMWSVDVAEIGRSHMALRMTERG